MDKKEPGEDPNTGRPVTRARLRLLSIESESASRPGTPNNLITAEQPKTPSTPSRRSTRRRSVTPTKASKQTADPSSAKKRGRPRRNSISSDGDQVAIVTGKGNKSVLGALLEEDVDCVSAKVEKEAITSEQQPSTPTTSARRTTRRTPIAATKLTSSLQKAEELDLEEPKQEVCEIKEGSVETKSVSGPATKSLEVEAENDSANEHDDVLQLDSDPDMEPNTEKQAIGVATDPNRADAILPQKAVTFHSQEVDGEDEAPKATYPKTPVNFSKSRSCLSSNASNRNDSEKEEEGPAATPYKLRKFSSPGQSSTPIVNPQPVTTTIEIESDTEDEVEDGDSIEKIMEAIISKYNLDDSSDEPMEIDSSPAKEDSNRVVEPKEGFEEREVPRRKFSKEQSTSEQFGNSAFDIDSDKSEKSGTSANVSTNSKDDVHEDMELSKGDPSVKSAKVSTTPNKGDSADVKKMQSSGIAADEHVVTEEDFEERDVSRRKISEEQSKSEMFKKSGSDMDFDKSETIDNSADVSTNSKDDGTKDMELSKGDASVKSVRMSATPNKSVSVDVKKKMQSSSVAAEEHVDTEEGSPEREASRRKISMDQSNSEMFNKSGFDMDCHKSDTTDNSANVSTNSKDDEPVDMELSKEDTPVKSARMSTTPKKGVSADVKKKMQSSGVAADDLVDTEEQEASRRRILKRLSKSEKFNKSAYNMDLERSETTDTSANGSISSKNNEPADMDLDKADPPAKPPKMSVMTPKEMNLRAEESGGTPKLNQSKDFSPKVKVNIEVTNMDLEKQETPKEDSTARVAITHRTSLPSHALQKSPLQKSRSKSVSNIKDLEGLGETELTKGETQRILPKGHPKKTPPSIKACFVPLHRVTDPSKTVVGEQDSKVPSTKQRHTLAGENPVLNDGMEQPEKMSLAFKGRKSDGASETSKSSRATLADDASARALVHHSSYNSSSEFLEKTVNDSSEENEPLPTSNAPVAENAELLKSPGKKSVEKDMLEAGPPKSAATLEANVPAKASQRHDSYTNRSPIIEPHVSCADITFEPIPISNAPWNKTWLEVELASSAPNMKASSEFNESSDNATFPYQGDSHATRPSAVKNGADNRATTSPYSPSVSMQTLAFDETGEKEECNESINDASIRVNRKRRRLPSTSSDDVPLPVTKRVRHEHSERDANVDEMGADSVQDQGEIETFPEGSDMQERESEPEEPENQLSGPYTLQYWDEKLAQTNEMVRQQKAVKADKKSSKVASKTGVKVVKTKGAAPEPPITKKGMGVKHNVAFKPDKDKEYRKKAIAKTVDCFENSSAPIEQKRGEEKKAAVPFSVAKTVRRERSGTDFANADEMGADFVQVQEEIETSPENSDIQEQENEPEEPETQLSGPYTLQYWDGDLAQTNEIVRQQKAVKATKKSSKVASKAGVKVVKTQRAAPEPPVSEKRMGVKHSVAFKPDKDKEYRKKAIVRALECFEGASAPREQKKGDRKKTATRHQEVEIQKPGSMYLSEDFLRELAANEVRRFQRYNNQLYGSDVEQEAAGPSSKAGAKPRRNLPVFKESPATPKYKEQEPIETFELKTGLVTVMPLTPRKRNTKAGVVRECPLSPKRTKKSRREKENLDSDLLYRGDVPRINSKKLLQKKKRKEFLDKF